MVAFIQSYEFCFFRDIYFCRLAMRCNYMLSTVRLIAVCQKEQVSSLDKRQIPINIDENLFLKLQFDDSCLTCNHHNINKKSQTYQTFLKAFQKLTNEQLQNTLCVSISQIKEYIPRCISCIGCRTSIDNFIKTIIEYRHQALEPIIINENNLFTIKKSYYSCPDYIYTLFYIHGSKLNSFISSIPKSKKSRRCYIHSLDKIKSINDWQIVWDLMNKECRDEITLVETDSLFDSLENYLHKHRFCSECKLKVLEAYNLLLDRKSCDKKDYSSSLYEGLQSCNNDKHIHIRSDKKFLTNLISRVQLEIEDNHRERHAKTFDIAQEEILTCIAIYLYERFEKIYRIIRSEEQIWQLLFYIIIDCLRLNFEINKEDFNMTFKILCEEFYINDQIKTSKKSKKIKKKNLYQIKMNEIKNIPNKNQLDHQQEQNLNICSRITNSCFCHYHSYNQQPISLIKSQSYPSSLLFSSEQQIPLSTSFETIFSSISTQYCTCHEKNSTQQSISPCIRCSSTRTDLGYSSDDISSSGLGETCIEYLTDCKNSNESIIDCRKTIELCDITRKPKLKLQLSDEYPFFTMDLKQIWDETLPTMIENTSFISDDDLKEFFLVNTHLEIKRAQLREFFKFKYQIWQEKNSK